MQSLNSPTLDIPNTKQTDKNIYEKSFREGSVSRYVSFIVNKLKKEENLNKSPYRLVPKVLAL